jgi:uncharacterized protein
MRSLLRHRLPALLAAVLAVAPAAAATPEVRDDAGFFSASAIHKANEIIRDIEQRDHKDLLIETFKSPPDDKVKLMERAERDRFFNTWAIERAKEAELNGVYVLICKEPGHIQIEVGNKTLHKTFTVENRNHLRDLLAERFRAKEFDKGLLEGVEYVRDAMRENLAGAPSRSEGPPVLPGPQGTPAPETAPNIGIGWGWLCPAALVVGGLLLVGVIVLSLLRSFSRPMGGGGYGPGYGPGPGGYGPGYGAPAPGYGGGGGGFFSSLFGSLFGSAAGNWAYDRFFRGSAPSAPWPNQQASQAPGNFGYSEPPGSQVDTSYSGTGADFDSGGAPDLGSPPDNSGGADFSSGSDSSSSSGDNDSSSGGADF